jgi:hypothetical protein
MNRTNRQITPTKTETVFQHLYDLPNTFFERMEQEEVYLSYERHPSSSHNMDLSIVQKFDMVK